jgi:hypothetical protein
MTDALLSPVFLSLAAGVLICLGSTLSHYWYKSRKAALEAELKMEMIQRGMSADEICQVIQSRTGEGCGSSRARD